MSDDEIDIYFDEIFDPAATTTVSEGDHILAAGQWQEHKMTFVGQPISVGLVSGLCVDTQLKPAARQARIADVMRQLHTQQYARGMMCSIIIPTSDVQRQWLKSIGYMTVTHLLSAETQIPAAFRPDGRVEVTEAQEWGRELWIFYAQHGGQHDFELRLSENDFFAMIARHDLRGGSVLVALTHASIVGL